MRWKDGLMAELQRMEVIKEDAMERNNGEDSHTVPATHIGKQQKEKDK